MDIQQLRCVLGVADEMHFGRAAVSLSILPASLGRQIAALEAELGVRLFERTTRSVALTTDGREFVREIRPLVGQLDELVERFRDHRRSTRRVIRLGAIDSAAAGLVPSLIRDFHEAYPDLSIELMEEKSIRLIPKLLSGRLDIAIIRPSSRPDARLTTRFLFHEHAIVALPPDHTLIALGEITVPDLVDVPMIIPERRSRPHSHDLTIKLFEQEGLTPRIGQIAEEKQTILNMVAANIGAAIVPLWSARLAVPGVVFRRLRVANQEGLNRLPLAIAWRSNVRDANRDKLIKLLQDKLLQYIEMDSDLGASSPS